MTLPGVMTPFRRHGNLLFMNIAETLRSEPVARFVENARDGLALTFVGRGEPGPPVGRRREQLMTTAAIVGSVLIGLSLLAVGVRRDGSGRGDELAAVFAGLLLLAPRFRLTAWRLGLFICAGSGRRRGELEGRDVGGRGAGCAVLPGREHRPAGRAVVDVRPDAGGPVDRDAGAGRHQRGRCVRPGRRGGRSDGRNPRLATDPRGAGGRDRARRGGAGPSGGVGGAGADRPRAA